MAYKIMGTTSSPFYANMMIYYIMCDTPADLPSTISDIGYGTTIGYGSRADIISDSSKYIWNGSQWVRQTTGGGGGASSADQVSYDNTDSGLTATNVQDAIDELKDNDDMQDRALAELYGEDANQQLEINYAINTGAKNLCPYNQITATAAGTVINDQPINLSSGTYILSFDHTATTGSTAFRFLKDGVSVLSFTVNNSSTGKETRTFTLPSEANQIRIYTDTANTYTDIMIRNADIRNSTYEPYAKTNSELTVAESEDRDCIISQMDNGGAKNILNLNTSFTTHTHKGVTYTNNGDGTINVSGTSNAVDSYVTLYDRNEDNLFGVQIGETIVLRSTSNDISINLIYKKQGGGYGLTVYGYKDSPATFTIPSDFVGFLLRIGVPRNNTTVNEDVSAMICREADYTISPNIVPYAPTNLELYEMILALQSGRSVQSVSSLSKLNLSRDETLETDEIKETEDITPLETEETEETE